MSMHSSTCLPSHSPPWRAQKKSCPSFSSSQPSGSSRWSRPLEPAPLNRPKTACHGFSPGDLVEGCGGAGLHHRVLPVFWGTLSCVGYSLPVHLAVLLWMPTSLVSDSGPQPRLLCPLQAPEGAHCRPTPPLGRMDLCHSHGTGQLLFFIVMGNL